MGEIPEDVLKAAAVVWAALPKESGGINAIARAIADERERCADNVGAYRRMVADSEELEVLEHVIRQGGIEP